MRNAIFSLLLLLTACKTAEKPSIPATPIVWPPAPAEPRIAFVQSVTKPGDLGFKVSGFSRFTQWLTGVGKGAASFSKPFGIAMDEAGNLCITDTGEGVVWYFDRNRKKFERWERIAKKPLITPVAVAKTNNLIFIADSGTAKVLAIAPNGKLMFEIKEPLVRPSGLAIAGGKLFVADAQLHSVVVFDLAGRFLSRFGKRGTEPGELNFPTHIAVSATGELLVTDSMNARIQVFDTNGKLQRSIGSAGDTSGHFSRPKGVATDTANRLYVIDAAFDNVQIFDPEGHFLLHLGQAGTGTGEFWLPNGIAISRDNQIYVTDSYNRRVQVFKYIGQ